MSQACENTEIQKKISLLAWHNLYDFKNDCAGSFFFFGWFLLMIIAFSLITGKNIFELYYIVL